ncbi:unnamed protein product, partial [Medioppia subpectinata]
IIKITNGIDLLNKSLHSLVCDKYEDLLSELNKMDTLEEVLRVIQTRIECLLTAVYKIRSKLVDPYDRICQQIVVLNRLQKTCDLLRRTIRIIHLIKRLNDNRFDATDGPLMARQLTKTAQYISQIDSIVNEDTNGSLNKINVIRDDLKSVVGVRNTLIISADQLFSIGLAEQDSNQLGSALQVYYSLRILDQKIRQIIDEKQEYMRKAVNEATDVSALNQNRSSGPGRVVIPMTIAQNSSLRSTLRQNIETLIDNIYNTFSQISLIYRLVKKRRDTLTNSCLIDQLNQTDSEGLNHFWTFVTKTLSEQLCKVANDSQTIRQALETEYPNYLNSFSELWKRISRDHKDINAEKVLRSSMQAFESAYLSRSLSLLFDSVNKVFADAKEPSLNPNAESIYTANVPSEKDIDLIIRHISTELHASAVDHMLCQSVAKNVTKTINLFVQKCEQLNSTDGHSTQVIGPFTPSQRLNAAIVDRLQMFRMKINKLLVTSNCPIDCLKLVEQSLFPIENLMFNTLNPFFESITDAIEAILLTMHSENYSDTDRVANRTIQLFLRQITLIRPLSKRGRMRIAADFAQLEMALTPLCNPIGRLGRQYRILRSFKPLLFQSAESIAKSGAVGDLIPYSLILEFLISNYAPNDIKSSHQYMNWSLTSSLCAMSKFLATDRCHNIIDRCLQLFGGYGYLKDYPIQQLLRDTRVHRILEGTNEIMKVIIAKDLIDKHIESHINRNFTKTTSNNGLPNDKSSEHLREHTSAAYSS